MPTPCAAPKCWPTRISRGHRTGRRQATKSRPGPHLATGRLQRQGSERRKRGAKYAEAEGIISAVRSGDVALLRGTWLLRRAGYEYEETTRTRPAKFEYRDGQQVLAPKGKEIVITTGKWNLQRAARSLLLLL